MSKMETASPEEDLYKAAQTAHEKFFVPTNSQAQVYGQQVNRAYQAFETMYVENKEIEVDLTRMNSRSRILLIRQIIQKLANNLNNLVSIL